MSKSYYKFKCPYCGGESAVIREVSIEEYPMLKIVFDDEFPNRGPLAYLGSGGDDDGKFDTASVLCTGCRAEWSSTQSAFNTKAFYQIEAEGDEK